MLHLLLGRAGSGKTHLVRESLRQAAAAGNDRLVLLVPEQASFDNERALLRLLGPRDAQRVRVFSFSRLCDALARAYGGGAGRRLNDGGRAILMSEALEQARDSLQFYRRSAQGTELVHMLLEANTEFTTCGILPQDLRRAAGAAQMPMLGQKLRELSQILECYRALVAQSWLDPQEDLTRAASCLEEHPFFAGCTVYVDGFQSFTRQQYGVLRPLLRQAADVTVALCADQLEDPEHGMGLFSIVRQTAMGLIRAAKEENIPVASPQKLPPGRRFNSADLRVLEENLYRSVPQKQTEQAENVFLFEAANPYEEAAYVAATIRRLLTKGVCRAREIAVIARRMESYQGILDTALETCEVPYFMDQKRDITHEPLMRLVLSAFAAVRSGMDSESVLACIKTGLTGISQDAAAQLENYCFVWKISGRAWRAPFTKNPAGFSASFTDDDRAQLEAVEESRQRIIPPLEHFAAATADKDGLALSKAVYRFLEEVGAAQHLRELAARLEQAGQPALADNALRLWDLLMEVLDQCALVLGSRPVSRRRYEELLRMVLAGSQMATIPQGVDEVTVGAADRIRVESPKVVFLLDAAKDDFPQAPGTAGVLSFAERLSLIHEGLPLNDTLAGVDVQERFLAYAAVSAPSQRLYLSWPASGTDGAEKFASSIVQQVRAILRGLRTETVETLPPAYFAVSRKAAFAQLARSWGHGTPEEATLRALFTQEADKPRLQALERAGTGRPAQFSDAKFARALFGKTMRISASQAETYALCPFQYFCRYGLRAKERRPAELDPLEYGSLMHALLECLFRDTGAEGILQMTEAELQNFIGRLLHAYVAEKMGAEELASPRFAFLLGRVASAATVVTRHIARELSQSSFVPAAFELPIGTEGGIPGLHLELPDGGSVELVGKVDRVDAWQADGRTWLRVVDYKTGKKKWKLSDLLYGLNLQMLLYLAALQESQDARWPSPAPAGVLYMPAVLPAASVERETSIEQQMKKQAAELCMSGMVRDDPAILTAMEKEAAGVYLPVRLKGGQPVGRGSAVSAPEMQALLAYSEEQVRRMGAQLHSGKVPARPLVGREYNACLWCPYAAVCGWEPQGPVREMLPVKPDDALRILTEKGEKAE